MLLVLTLGEASIEKLIVHRFSGPATT